MRVARRLGMSLPSLVLTALKNLSKQRMPASVSRAGSSFSRLLSKKSLGRKGGMMILLS
jgi:hypothetical protein